MHTTEIKAVAIPLTSAELKISYPKFFRNVPLESQLSLSACIHWEWKPCLYPTLQPLSCAKYGSNLFKARFVMPFSKLAIDHMNRFGLSWSVSIDTDWRKQPNSQTGNFCITFCLNTIGWRCQGFLNLGHLPAMHNALLWSYGPSMRELLVSSEMRSNARPLQTSLFFLAKKCHVHWSSCLYKCKNCPLVSHETEW